VYSSSSPLRKEIVVRLRRCSELKALDKPVVVVSVPELKECKPELLNISKVADPEQLFLKAAKESLDAAVSFGLANERRR
jgi:hypothetical protein